VTVRAVQTARYRERAAMPFDRRFHLFGKGRARCTSIFALSPTVSSGELSWTYVGRERGRYESFGCSPCKWLPTCLPALCESLSLHSGSQQTSSWIAWEDGVREKSLSTDLGSHSRTSSQGIVAAFEKADDLEETRKLKQEDKG